MNRFLLPPALIVGLGLLAPSAFGESCYKVNLKQKIDVKKCDAVPVILTVHDCADDKTILDEKTLSAAVDCR